MKKVKKVTKLPKELVIIGNPDKAFHEAWNPTRDMLDIPHPYRAVLTAPPNRGKTLVVKNLLLRANPPFRQMVVVHCDGGYTQEYDDVSDDLEILSEIPAPEDWTGEEKTLCVLDDLEFKTMGKQQRRCLDRLFGYVSTHKNVSVILCSQDPFSLPCIVRRCANLFILWRLADLDSQAQISRKTGMKSANLHNIFDNLMTDYHDSLWIDTTTGSPYPLRKNGYIPITKISGKETLKKENDQDKFTVREL
jgi:hypothetical protein